MSAIFAKYQALVAQYRALQPLSVEAQRALDKKFRLEFNFNSNHIEGNTLTYAETELLLIFDGTKGDHELREYEEMKAHDVAWSLVQDWAKSDRPLRETEVKELNKVILVRPFWKDAITADRHSTRRLIKVGDYKEHPNSVRLQNGEIFEYASVIDTPIKMGELIQWFHTALKSSESDPLQIAAKLHYDFVRIHPFDDGNGRISRLLMNYVLLKYDLPPVIIKSKDKAGYLRALNRADVGDFEAFVDYLAQQACWGLELCVKAAKGESVEEIDDIDKELELLNRKLKETRSDTIAYASEVANFIDSSIKDLFVFFLDRIKKIEPAFSRNYKRVIFDVDRLGSVEPEVDSFLNSGIKSHIEDCYVNTCFLSSVFEGKTKSVICLIGVTFHDYHFTVSTSLSAQFPILTAYDFTESTRVTAPNPVLAKEYDHKYAPLSEADFYQITTPLLKALSSIVQGL